MRGPSSHRLHDGGDQRCVGEVHASRGEVGVRKIRRDHRAGGCSAMSWFGMKGLKGEVEVRGDEWIRDERRGRNKKEDKVNAVQRRTRELVSSIRQEIHTRIINHQIMIM
jgi:hypothetical protein